MQKILSQPKAKIKKRDEVASIIAAIHDVTPRYVRLVYEGKKKNDKILADYLLYNQGKNKLIQSLKKAVPFSKN